MFNTDPPRPNTEYRQIDRDVETNVKLALEHRYPNRQMAISTWLTSTTQTNNESTSTTTRSIVTPTH